MTEELYAALKAMEGEESEPRKANDRVSEAMIRHWCEALEDPNPLYTDDEFAKASEYGGVVAPPTMIQAYCVPPLWPPYEGPPPPIFKAVQRCVDAGYPATVGISHEYEFLRPLLPGDEITFQLKFVSVSAPKKTKLGTGYFLTSQYTYRNQRHEIVCRQWMTVYQYKP
ncbi:MAG: MaoC family dehydratase [Chloroflexi bacterium]|nr:MaoC family dehydratase [Chloroflexota bacterium]